MKKLLIINADDYNISKGVNRAITGCIKCGTVTSVSAFVNLPLADTLDARVSIGLHFNLGIGPSLSKKRSSLTDKNGNFSKSILFDRDRRTIIKEDDIYEELSAQYDKFISIFGRGPSHIDTHYHIHRYKKFYVPLEKFCIGKKLPFRKRYFTSNAVFKHSPRYTYCRFSYNNPWNKFDFIKQIKSLKEGVSEIIVHPGIPCKDLSRFSGLFEERMIEYKVLSDADVTEALKKSDIKLIGYGEYGNIAYK